MKKTISSVLLFLTTLFATAQFNPGDSIEITDLEIPSSPAFILLDQAPSVISRLEDPKAFTFNLLNTIVQDNNLPRNFAMEVTPFWYFSKNNETALKHKGIKQPKKDKFVQAPFHNLNKASLSMALVTSIDSLSGMTQNNLSFGFRTNILTLFRKKYAKDLGNKYKKSFRSTEKLVEDAQNEALKNNINLESAEFAKLFENLVKERKLDSIAILTEQKPLLALDGAIAYSRLFDNDNFNSDRFGRFGAWLTLSSSYKFKRNNGFFNFYVLTRWLQDETVRDAMGMIKERDYFDVGAKIEFEFKKLVLSLEHISRSGENTPNTKRTSGVINFKVNDDVQLEGSFGNNFGMNDDLISLFGVRWGLNTGNEKQKLENPMQN